MALSVRSWDRPIDSLTAALGRELPKRLSDEVTAFPFASPEADRLVTANSGQKPTFQSCPLVRNPSTCNGGRGRSGQPGRRRVACCSEERASATTPVIGLSASGCYGPSHWNIEV